MKVAIVFFLYCVLLSSCSFTGSINRQENAWGKSTEELKNIRIERWGEVRFSGLLALRINTGGLSYAVLDVTGVKLIEANIDLSGEYHLLEARGPLKTSTLPGYLSESLYRIYLSEPEQFLDSKSLQNSEWSKCFMVGPFTVWKAGKYELDDKNGMALNYTQPWLGVNIILEELKRVK